ncbi:MAG: hypothetical protein WCI79_02815 [Candidatus Saccharibacteria bacterium]
MKIVITKQRIIIVIAAVILVVSITVAVFVIFKPFDNPMPVKVVTKESADTLKKQAIDAMTIKDTATAKPLLEEAKKQYQILNDSNNVIDISAQLWILDHPVTPTEQ